MRYRLDTRVLATAALPLAVGCAAKEEAPPAPPPSPNVVTVHATDYAFDAPASIPSGFTTFNMHNGGATFHHVIVARVDSGKTLADVQAAFAKPGPPPAWLHNIGGPNSPDPQG